MSSRKRKRQIAQQVEQNKEKRLKEWLDSFGDEDFQAYTPEATMNMILDHPQAAWDWAYLSDEKEIEFIITHSNLRWDWSVVSGRAELEIIQRYMVLPWDWGVISGIIDYENFKKYEHTFPWNWNILSLNSSMAKETIVRDHIDKPWNWNNLSNFEDVATLTMLKDFPDKPWKMFLVTQKHDLETINSNPDIGWCWDSVSSKLELSWEDVDQNPDKPWNYSLISWNQKMTTLDRILAHLDEYWDWHPISYSPIATWENIVNYDLPWNWSAISRWNNHITRDIIDQNQDKPWDYHQLSHSKNIDSSDLEYLAGKYPTKNWCWVCMSARAGWSFIKTHLDLPWSWLVLSDREEIAIWENVLENIDKPWDWNLLSCHPDIATPDHVDKYPQFGWNYGVLIGLWKRTEYVNMLEQDLAAKKIQKWWKDILWHPLHPVGKRWIMRQICADVEAMDKRDGN